MDAEYDRRAHAFLRHSVDAGKPFFLYHNHSLMHFPMVSRQEFRGQSADGDWGDCLLMLDHDFGRILDYLTELGVAGNTIAVFAGDKAQRTTSLAGAWRASSTASTSAPPKAASGDRVPAGSGGTPVSRPSWPSAD
jgi:arylsulfatase A-like enzyme